MRLRNERVMEGRQRVLRPSKVPIGMARPRHIERFGERERERKFLRLELVENHPVVDAQDTGALPVAVVPELASLLLDAGRTDSADAPELLGEREVDRGLLMRRIDVQEHDVLRRKPREDRLAENPAVALEVEPREKVAEPVSLRRDVRQGAGLVNLERIERWKGLKLDQPRLQRSVGPFHDGKVRLREERVRVAARYVPAR